MWTTTVSLSRGLERGQAVGTSVSMARSASGVSGMNDFYLRRPACHESDASRSPGGYGGTVLSTLSMDVPQNASTHLLQRTTISRTVFLTAGWWIASTALRHLSLGLPHSGATCFNLIAAFVSPWFAVCPRLVMLTLVVVPEPSTRSLRTVERTTEASSGTQCAAVHGTPAPG
jgi:hypothetical protein